MRAPRFEALRYVAAAILIAAGCGGLLLAFAGPAPDEASSEVDGAVMIELPTAEPSARPESDEQSGPAQAASAGAQAAPDAPKPPEEMPSRDKPPDEETPPATAEVAPAPPQAQPPKPQPPLAPVQPETASAAQAEMAPPGAQVPDPTATDDGDDGRPRPSAHAITLWQRSLMRRLEGARRQAAATPHATGTVTVAFSIDGRGALVSRRVARSSGSRSLDAAGLQLVQQAAPFPTPPAGSRDDDLTFTVPIRFR